MKKYVKPIISVCLVISIIFSGNLIFSSFLSFASADELTEIHRESFVNEDGTVEFGFVDDEGNAVTFDVDNRKTLLKSRSAVGTAGLPSYYSSVDEGYGTPVNNQGKYGLCWLYSATCALGTYNRMHYGVSAADSDYSEMHPFYYKCKMPTDVSDPLYGDGVNSEASYFANNAAYTVIGHSVFMRGTGLTSEYEFPYDENSYNINNYGEQFRYKHNYGIVTSAQAILPFYYSYTPSSELLNQIKEKIKEYGAVQVNCNFDDYYLNSNGAYYHSEKYDRFNHAVTIVGWNDNYSRDNFKSSNKPASDGAWIVQNSYGSNYGDNGFLYFSYNEGLSEIYYLSSVPNGTYNRIYQHDGYNSGDDTIEKLAENSRFVYKQAAVYTADDNNSLEAVNYYSAGDVNLDVKVYKNPVSGNPESGTQIYNGQFSGKSGYNFLKFNEPVIVKKGDKFSVVVSSSSSDNLKKSYLLKGGLYESNKTNPGESYYYIDSDSNNFKTNGWVDGSVGYNGVGKGDAPIKVYANASEESGSQGDEPEVSYSFKLQNGSAKYNSDVIVKAEFVDVPEGVYFVMNNVTFYSENGVAKHQYITQRIKSDFPIIVKAYDKNNNLLAKEECVITVNNSFWDRISAFFDMIFNGFNWGTVYYNLNRK